MTKMNSIALPMFSLDMHHIYRMSGEEWRYAYETNGTVTFSVISNPRTTVTYDYGTLSRLNGAGMIEVVPFGQMPEHLRPVPVDTVEGLVLSGLCPGKRRKFEARYAMVQAYETLKQAKAFKVNDAEIKASMDAIREEARAYLATELPDPETDLKIVAWKAGEGAKPRAQLHVVLPDEVSPSALRKWAYAYKKFGKWGLVDNHHKQGNRTAYFTAEEMTLMAKTINIEFLSLQRKPVAIVCRDVKQAFEKENEARAAEGKALLRAPGREAVRLFIKGLDKFRVLIARYGHKEALKRMRPVKDGMEADRPLQFVGMDEMKIDLLVILSQSGLLTLLAGEDMQQLEKLLRTMRWWLTLAIDYRTRMILGMVLSPNPKSSAAIKCLRMVVSDKGQFADAVGALAPWSAYGTPETLFVDNGSAFKSAVFTTTCLDLGITKVQTVAGLPAMRGKVERVFKTLQSSLLPRLSGRTFGDVVTRGNHPAEERACHTIEDFAFAIVRWVIDIYHNTPHEGLGGRTPLEQWEADIAAGNYPLMAAPTMRRKRIALGLNLTRTVQKDGIRALNVRYTSADLASWYLKNGTQVVNVRWFDENIGSLEVELDGAWHEIPAASPIFEGVDATTWAETRRALRAKDKDRKEWEEDVIAKAISDIEALNAANKIAHKVIDHAWTDARFEAGEREAMMSFNVIEPRAAIVDTADGHGRSIVPVAPVRRNLIAETLQDAPEATRSKGKWTFEK